MTPQPTDDLDCADPPSEGSSARMACEDDKPKLSPPYAISLLHLRTASGRDAYVLSPRRLTTSRTSYNNFALRARNSASTRLLAPSFSNRFDTCVLTVLIDTYSLSAIFWLL